MRRFVISSFLAVVALGGGGPRGSGGRVGVGVRGPPAGTVNGFAVDPADPKVMLVAMRDGVLRSDDGGGRWTPTRGGPNNAAAVAFNPKRPADVYAAAGDGQLFASHDGGQTWQPAR
jgi:photosystem II stability/assembly factor-like uncharacterized protein